MEQLPLPAEGTGPVRDIIPSQTPEFSTKRDELNLIQTMTDLARARIQVVGINATSPLDTMFLAQQVRRYCPNTLIFSTDANLLFTDPHALIDLRGMMVGSSDPLYPRNQTWDPNGDKPRRLFFTDDGEQCAYNAMIFHMDELFDLEKIGGHQRSDLLLEYGPPFPSPAFGPHRRRPPIWINTI